VFLTGTLIPNVTIKQAPEGPSWTHGHPTRIPPSRRSAPQSRSQAVELRGCDSSTARAHLIVAADSAEAPVEKVTAALVVLYD